MNKVAIVGCGQLARMLALAGWPMGIRFSFLACDNESTECVDGLGQIAHWSTREPVNPQALLQALGNPDVVTVERESVDTGLLRALADHVSIFPDADAVHQCQHRIREKKLLESLSIAATPYRQACCAEELKSAAQALGYPLVIKAASEGYDGKSQWRIHSDFELRAFLAERQTGDWLVEQFMDFDCELSLIAARSATGEIHVYPATENRHSKGVLTSSLAPFDTLPEQIAARGTANIVTLLEGLNYVGVLAMECFLVDGELLVNELAPRVHNSGHWTLQGELTSQFENHLRAILGMALGRASPDRYHGIVNILGHGERAPDLPQLPAQVSLHWYNKQPREGRKLGHLGASAHSHADLRKILTGIHQLLWEPRSPALTFLEEYCEQLPNHAPYLGAPDFDNRQGQRA